MNGEQDLDRREQASPYKLQEARKRGSVARSADLGSLAVLLVATAACFSLGMSALHALAGLMARGLGQDPVAAGSIRTVQRLASSEVLSAGAALAPLLFLLVVVIIAVGVLQTGGVWSFTPLKPDLDRVNPVKGLKRFFSVRLLYESLKSTLKLLVLGGVAVLALLAVAPGAARLAGLPARGLLFEMLPAAGALAAKLCVALAVFAVVDLAFSRWDFLRNMRMSRREQEDELKHREGDPRIRQRLRELRLQFLQRTRAVAKVPSASVLITNPTHVAVALRYEPGSMPAPQVVAKGAGRLAERMRDVAFRSRVPIVQSPALARALFSATEGQDFVPEQWYPQVARILVWLQAARREAGAHGPGGHRP